MTIGILLDRLEKEGFRIGLRNGRLLLRGPRAALSPTVYAQLQASRETAVRMVWAVVEGLIPPDSAGVQWATLHNARENEPSMDCAAACDDHRGLQEPGVEPYEEEDDNVLFHGGDWALPQLDEDNDQDNLFSDE